MRAMEIIFSGEPLRNAVVTDKLDLSQFHQKSFEKNLLADNKLT